MNTKNLPIIIGIALPLVFIAVISIVLFVPSLFVKPGYDFLYTTDERDYYYDYDGAYQNTFRVVDGRITLEPVAVRSDVVPVKPLVYKAAMPTLYRYDVETDTSREVSFVEAQKLSLDPGPSSPDGYTVEYDYGHDGIFEIFGSNGNGNAYVISKGNGGKRLTGLAGDRYYYGNFRLLGWVK